MTDIPSMSTSRTQAPYSVRRHVMRSLTMPAASLAAGGWLLLGGGVADIRAEAAAEEKIMEAQTFFVETVKPILEQHCVGCHGGEKAKAGLNMTTRDRLLEGGRSGPVIDLEHPEQSRLLVAISYTDEDLQMPPRKPLKESQVEALKQWVAAGALWADGVVLEAPPRGQ